MAKFFDKMMNAFGLAEFEEYEEIQEEENKEKKYESNRTQTDVGRDLSYNKSSLRGTSKIVNIHTNVQMEVVVIHPDSFDEAKDICLHLKSKKAVVINLENLEHNIAQRIMDFVSGACYALNGNIQRVNKQIFIIAPENVDIAGDVNITEELTTNGIIFPWSELKK